MFNKTTLISPLYVLKSKILLETYKENLAKCYRFENLFMYIGFQVLFEYLQGSNREIWNIPREAFGILIKSSQKINFPKYFDSSVNGILGYTLMIENQAV